MGEKVTVTLDGHELASFVTRAIQDRRIVVDPDSIISPKHVVIKESAVVKETSMDKENKELLAGYEDRENKSLDFKQTLRRKILEMLDEMGFRPASVEVVLAQRTDACQNYQGEAIKIEIQSKRCDLLSKGHSEVWLM